MITGNLNLTVNTESQKAVWFILPLLPIFIIFFIGSIAETNRAPFDLAEASLIDLASLKTINCWKILDKFRAISRELTIYLLLKLSETKGSHLI